MLILALQPNSCSAHSQACRVAHSLMSASIACQQQEGLLS